MNQIAVVDYGMGNLRSVAKALEHVAPKAKVVITADAHSMRAADRVIFPGQGAMPDCMREMDARGLREPVLEAAANKPFLGLCIGLQMLFDFSEEGDTPGLGLLAGRVERFRGARFHDGHDAQGHKLKVPHMGWNQVYHAQPHALWNGIESGARFYFVHSYYAKPKDGTLRAAYSEYPGPFACAVARDNLFAVQFHPEKSQAAGLRLLENFVSWNPQ
jgi:imidazole glycerol-phosphate synthase subunit HisH